MVRVYIETTRFNATYTGLADILSILQIQIGKATPKKQEKLLLSFYDGYHNASQYMSYINSVHP